MKIKENIERIIIEREGEREEMSVENVMEIGYAYTMHCDAMRCDVMLDV